MILFKFELLDVLLGLGVLVFGFLFLLGRLLNLQNRLLILGLHDLKIMSHRLQFRFLPTVLLSALA